MKYMLLIQFGDAPSPDSRDRWAQLSEDAELLRRLDRVEDARAAYGRALELVHSDAEWRFLARRAGRSPRLTCVVGEGNEGVLG